MSGKKKKRSRVLIVDDHPAVREALALRIGRQPDLQVKNIMPNMIGWILLAKGAERCTSMIYRKRFHSELPMTRTQQSVRVR
jgi:hypothetical protein